jgi:hypothetical protein
MESSGNFKVNLNLRKPAAYVIKKLVTKMKLTKIPTGEGMEPLDKVTLDEGIIGMSNSCNRPSSNFSEDVGMITLENKATWIQQRF